MANDQEQRLEQLRARIQQLQTSLNELQGRRDDVREELRDLERRIGSLLHGQMGAPVCSSHFRAVRAT